MDWPEISTEDFPPRRDDEPSTLRQDIIDELSDHFECALNRELLKNPDEQLARRRVLEQFGNPIAIARQLWLDAMKEKIMSQRIMTGLFAVMAVCCIAVVGIAWSMMQESRAFNLQLLEQFKLAQERSSAEVHGDLHSIVFQLVSEGDKEKPPTGFVGKLTRLEGQEQIFTVDAVSEDTGLLDFGKLPWGKYKMKLRSPWDEEWSELTFSTLPGRKYEETIICPAGVPGKVPVQFEVKWPTRPAEENYYLLCDFRVEDPWALVNRYHMRTIHSFQQNSALSPSYWTYRYGENQKLAEFKGIFLIDVLNNQIAPCPLTADGEFKKIDFHELVWGSSLELLKGEYFPPVIYLLRKDKLSRINEINSINQVETIVRLDNGFMINDNYGSKMGLIISPFQAFEIAPQVMKSLEQNRKPFAEKSDTTQRPILGYRDNRKDAAYSFIATKDQPNVWKINIPDLFPITLESGSLSSAR